MGSFDFERPVGANADVMELEYIAALHQSDDAVYESYANASIESSDVKYYLLSRYGIVATKEAIRTLIFRGLAGGDGEDDCIDIVEIVAILLIPFFSKITDQSNEAEDHEENEDYKTIRTENEQLRKECKDIVSDILNTILHETTGSHEPRPLTKNLIYDIFAHYDELDLIQSDDTLMDEMIKLATGGEDNAMLTTETFMRALTDDIKLYNTANETRKSTHYQDVFGIARDDVNGVHIDSVALTDDFKLYNTPNEARKSTHYEDALDIDGDDVNGADIESVEIKQEREFQRVFYFPQIDMLADTYRSKTQFILSLMACVLSVYVYFLRTENTDFISVCPKERSHTYACDVGLKIVIWIYRMTLIICIGIPATILLNLGNDLHNGSILGKVGGFLAALILVICPGLLDIDLYVIETVKSDLIDVYLSFILIGIGCTLAIIQVSSIIQQNVPHDINVPSFLLGSAVRNEVDIKIAAATKVHKMVQNAYALHKTSDDTKRTANLSRMVGNDTAMSSNAVALLNFTKQSNMTETSGGFFWSWKQFYSGSLLTKEGIWIHTRILAANFAQLFILIGVIMVSVITANKFTRLLVVGDEVTDKSNASAQVDEWMVHMSLAFGIIAALIAGIYNATLNIPSIVMTTLQFRSGVLPSLRDINFKKYRASMFRPTTLIGASFWGTLVMTVLIVTFVTIPIFVLVYPGTNVYIWKYSPHIIGITVTVTFRIIAEMLLTKYSFAGFYRKHPVVCNIATVGLECWNFLLASTFIVLRAVKIICITFLFIGRFDRPFLADRIGMIGRIEFDSYPTVFRQDLLATDAHRHPYIERMGLMYMMKLRHGEKFGKQAGSIWRIIFVMALMPWLRKYRIVSGESMVEDNIELKVGKTHVAPQIKELEETNKELEEANKKLKARLEEIEGNLLQSEF